MTCHKHAVALAHIYVLIHLVLPYLVFIDTTVDAWYRSLLSIFSIMYKAVVYPDYNKISARKAWEMFCEQETHKSLIRVFWEVDFERLGATTDPYHSVSVIQGQFKESSGNMYQLYTVIKPGDNVKYTTTIHEFDCCKGDHNSRTILLIVSTYWTDPEIEDESELLYIKSDLRLLEKFKSEVFNRRYNKNVRLVTIAFVSFNTPLPIEARLGPLKTELNANTKFFHPRDNENDNMLALIRSISDTGENQPKVGGNCICLKRFDDDTNAV